MALNDGVFVWFWLQWIKCSSSLKFFLAPYLSAPKHSNRLKTQIFHTCLLISRGRHWGFMFNWDLLCISGLSDAETALLALSWNGCLKRTGRCVTLWILHVGFVKSLFSSSYSKMQYLFDLLNDDSELHFGDVRGNGIIFELFGCSEENESRLCWWLCWWRIWFHDRRWQRVRRRWRGWM